MIQGVSRQDLKKSRAHLRDGQPMINRFVPSRRSHANACRARDEHRDIWPVRVMCRVRGVSASGYYLWRTRGESPSAKANRALLGTIRAIHAESGGAYGAPRVHAVLRSHGRRVGRHRIARLMRGPRLRGLAAIPRRVRTTDSRHDHPPLGKTVHWTVF
jgi:hypothetical protein